MSEAERKRRQDYKKQRLKWIIIQSVALFLVASIALGAFLIYRNMNRTYYIHYTEQGNVDYRVHYKENSFFEEEWIGPGQAYIVSLIDGVLAEFKYDLAMDTDRVNFDYGYSVDAQILVFDKISGAPLYSPTYELLPEKTANVDGNRIHIREKINIDYIKYNTITKNFTDAYGIVGAKCSLVITLNVSVLGKCDSFENNSENAYFVSLNIPLNLETVDAKITSSVAEEESKVLACSGAESKDAFLTVGIVAAVLFLLLGGVFLAFVYLTRNEDINYTIKVKKIVSAYRSFIQQVNGEFDMEGYQTVYIKSFVELLGIRDTIQSPVLMSENYDCTCTKFLIPTATKLLYVFEIKVDNYDELYGTQTTYEEEPIILEENVDREALAEAMATPDVVLSEIEFVPDDDNDFAVPQEEPGVEVVGVVWPERAHRNKVYRYDPNGEQLHEGDVVLVPTRDAEKNREVIRKAAVAHENHWVEPEHIKHPLKKIIAVVKRKVENALAPTENKATEEEPKE